jgi:hypothetical protein
VHLIALTAAALPAALLLSPTAWADPVAPHSDTSCASDLSGVMTWPQNDTMPLVCADQPGGHQWETVTTPQPPNDRWLSTGPAVTLHGEGQRNPNVESGDWTATPQDPAGRCRAEQQVVVSPGVLGAPAVSESAPGEPLSFQVLPRLFTITLSGDCLWARG